MKYILIITPNGMLGGTERFIENFYKVMDKNKYRIDFLLYRKWDSKFLKKFQSDGCRFYFMPYYIKKPFEFIGEMYKFYKIHKEYEYIYCHANHALCMLYTFPIWCSKDKKIFFHSHNSTGNHKLLQRILSNIIKVRCNRLFACSLEAGKYMYGKNTDFVVIKNKIDIGRYAYNPVIRSALRRKYGITDELVIGHIGGFREQKNQQFILRILEALLNLKNNINIKVILIGDGIMRNKIQQEVSEKKMDSKVIFVDGVENVEEYYQMFDLFVLPSIYEGLPFVGIESQASGTYSMFSDVIDPKLAITPLANFFSLDSPEVWAKYIILHMDEFKNKKDYSDLLIKAGYGLDGLEKEYGNAWD